MTIARGHDVFDTDDSGLWLGAAGGLSFFFLAVPPLDVDPPASVGERCDAIPVCVAAAEAPDQSSCETDTFLDAEFSPNCLAHARQIANTLRFCIVQLY